MLIKNEDGTFTGGPLDVLCILHDATTGRYHAAFFEEAPLPGPVPEVKDTKVVRLKSKFHHTEGADTIESARGHLFQLKAKIHVPAENIWRKDAMEWDGEIGVVVILPNWRTENRT